MKLGWLVWMEEDDKDPLLLAGDGDRRLDYCFRKVRVVYDGVTTHPGFTPLVPCPVCGGEAVHAQDVLARLKIAPDKG